MTGFLISVIFLFICVTFVFSDHDLSPSSTTFPLHSAVLNGNLSHVLHLLTDPNVNVNQPNEHQLSALYLAYATNRTTIANALLKACANWNVRLMDGKRMIDLAAQKGHLNVIKQLLANGVPLKDEDSVYTFNSIGYKYEYVDSKDPKWQPMHYALQSGQFEVIKYLIQHQPDDTYFDGTFHELISELDESLALKIVKLVITKSSKLNTTNYKASTLLSIFSSVGYSSIVQYLLSRGANVSFTNYRQETALHRASAKGHLKVVKLLIDSNVNGNAKDAREETPLMLAARAGHLSIVKLLIDRGALIGKGERNPIVCASFGNGPIEMIRYLVLDKNISYSLNSILERKVVSENSYVRYSFLYSLVMLRKFEIAKFLIEHQKFTFNRTEVFILRKSFESKNLKFFKYLLNKVGPLDAIDVCKAIIWTSTIYEMNVSLDNFKFMVSCSKCLNPDDCFIKSTNNATYDYKNSGPFDNKWLRVPFRFAPFYFAVLESQFDILKYLFDQTGTLADKLNSTQLFLLACEKGNFEIVKLLAERFPTLKYYNWTTQKSNPLTVAIKSGKASLELIKYLILNGFGRLGQPELVIDAIETNRTDLTIFLIENGAKYETKKADRMPLQLAAKNNNLELVKYLRTKSDIDVNSLDNLDRTPLYYAVRHAQLDLVKYLVLNERANTSLRFSQSKDGCDDLFLMSIYRNMPQMTHFLIEHNAPVVDCVVPDIAYWSNSDSNSATVTDCFSSPFFRTSSIPFQMSPILGSFVTDDLDTFKVLVQKGVQASRLLMHDDFLYYASIGFKDQPKIANYLLFEYRNVVTGQTILHEAVEVAGNDSYFNLVEFVLRRGVQINARDVHNSTAMHLAAASGYEEMMHLLARQKCIDLKARNTRGQTAFDVALRRYVSKLGITNSNSNYLY